MIFMITGYKLSMHLMLKVAFWLEPLGSLIPLPAGILPNILLLHSANTSPIVSNNACCYTDTLLTQLARQPAVLMCVASTQGSVPRSIRPRP